MHLMMLKGTLDTAVGIDWERPWIKILLGKWRIIVRWLLCQFMVGAAGGAAASRYATRGTLNKTRGNEELGIF
jgi:hypothetical protein